MSVVTIVFCSYGPPRESTRKQENEAPSCDFSGVSRDGKKGQSAFIQHNETTRIRRPSAHHHRITLDHRRPSLGRRCSSSMQLAVRLLLLSLALALAILLHLASVVLDRNRWRQTAWPQRKDGAEPDLVRQVVLAWTVLVPRLRIPSLNVAVEFGLLLAVGISFARRGRDRASGGETERAEGLTSNCSINTPCSNRSNPPPALVFFSRSSRSFVRCSANLASSSL